MRLKSNGFKAIILSSVPKSPWFRQTRTINVSMAGCVVMERNKVNLVVVVVVVFFCFLFPSTLR